ncbi:hypothetical protein COCHEDRAFT_1019094, partial [Bipolaris maydis C5]
MDTSHLNTGVPYKVTLLRDCGCAAAVYFSATRTSTLSVKPLFDIWPCQIGGGRLESFLFFSRKI